MIKVIISKQTLEHYQNNTLVQTYPVSTAQNGTGEAQNSYCTPTGVHRIYAKIGGGLAIGSILVGRKPTGEVYTKKLAVQYPQKDWILTRIIWLDGCEHKNKNTKGRYIYIHGTPNDTDITKPLSKGCIRMRNKDIIKLFESVKINDKIAILK